MQARFQTINKDYLGGVLVFALGVGAIAVSRSYPIGTLGRMGPGFFPKAIGCILALTGAAIFITAAFAKTKPPPLEWPDWRAWFFVPLAVLAFIILGAYAGFLPATFVAVFIAALADRLNTLKSACLVALFASCICVVVFWWALQIPFALVTFGAP